MGFVDPMGRKYAIWKVLGSRFQCYEILGIKEAKTRYEKRTWNDDDLPPAYNLQDNESLSYSNKNCKDLQQKLNGDDGNLKRREVQNRMGKQKYPIETFILRPVMQNLQAVSTDFMNGPEMKHKEFQTRYAKVPDALLPLEQFEEIDLEREDPI
ncbi:hypothetical protein AM593_00588, partial [Mytilus galloprovincialis]